jgi:hypothetical protein
MKQNDSKYHLLYLQLKDFNAYFPLEGRKYLLDLVKDLYNEHQALIEAKDDCGKYGIAYNTIDEDSSRSDKHEQFFDTKAKRDAVYDDWINDRVWDTIFDQDLRYRTPAPNVHEIKKIFKESGVIYEERT